MTTAPVPSILIIDDESAILDALRILLKNEDAAKHVLPGHSVPCWQQMTVSASSSAAASSTDSGALGCPLCWA